MGACFPVPKKEIKSNAECMFKLIVSAKSLVLMSLQVGADIVKRALSYPLKLIAKNAGVNGSVVIEKVQAH